MAHPYQDHYISCNLLLHTISFACNYVFLGSQWHIISKHHFILDKNILQNKNQATLNLKPTMQNNYPNISKMSQQIL